MSSLPPLSSSSTSKIQACPVSLYSKAVWTGDRLTGNCSLFLMWCHRAYCCLHSCCELFWGSFVILSGESEVIREIPRSRDQKTKTTLLPVQAQPALPALPTPTAPYFQISTERLLPLSILVQPHQAPVSSRHAPLHARLVRTGTLQLFPSRTANSKERLAGFPWPEPHRECLLLVPPRRNLTHWLRLANTHRRRANICREKRQKDGNQRETQTRAGYRCLSMVVSNTPPTRNTVSKTQGRAWSRANQFFRANLAILAISAQIFINWLDFFC